MEQQERKNFLFITSQILPIVIICKVSGSSNINIFYLIVLTVCPGCHSWIPVFAGDHYHTTPHHTTISLFSPTQWPGEDWRPTESSVYDGTVKPVQKTGEGESWETTPDIPHLPLWLGLQGLSNIFTSSLATFKLNTLGTILPVNLG